MSGNGATGDAAAVTAAVNGILKDEAPAAMDEVDPLVGGDLLNDDDMMLGDLDNLGCQVRERRCGRTRMYRRVGRVSCAEL